MSTPDTMQAANEAWMNARHRMGAGWDLMSEQFQEALAAREILRIIIREGMRPGWYGAAHLAHEAMTLNHAALNRERVLGKREQL